MGVNGRPTMEQLELTTNTPSNEDNNNKALPSSHNTRSTVPPHTSESSIPSHIPSIVNTSQFNHESSSHSKSLLPPAFLPSQGFTADDKVEERTTLTNWDPVRTI